MATTPPDYEPLGPLGGDSVQLRFGGTFEGAATRWDATFLTLTHYRRCYAPECPALRNFIDIGATGANGRQLMVALDVAALDAATVHKMVVMVRNYKRLQVGRHWFGAEKRFDPA